MARPFLLFSLPLLLLMACAGPLSGTPQEPTVTQFENFQAASLVIGQPDFTSNSGSTISGSSISFPIGRPLVHADRLYLPDSANERILVYEQFPTANGDSADLVLGQPDFTSAVPGNGASELSDPLSLAAHGDRIVAADYGNNRVLIWNSPPTTNQEAADLVVGQAGFGTSTATCTQTGLNSPESLTLAAGKLIVSDSGNHRVLIWNDIPTTNGEPADLVLGQDTFDSCIDNDDDQDGTADLNPTARTYAYPSGVWSDGSRLIVADANNYRVLIWTTFPTTNFQPADFVLGQEDFTTAVAGLTADTFQFPYFLHSDGTQLFVADTNGNRVLVWDQIPSANGVPADHVLGQSAFTTNTPNDDDQDSVTDAGPTARTLNYPTGVYFFDGKLLVTDGLNNRYLLYE